MDLDGSKLSILILDENARFYTKWRLQTFRALDLKWFKKVSSISFQKLIFDSDFDLLNTIGLNDQPEIKTLNELQLPVPGMQKIAKKKDTSIWQSNQEFLFSPLYHRLQRDHPFITSTYFQPFWTPPTHLISLITVMNVRKTGHFLDPPTQFFC